MRLHGTCLFACLMLLGFATPQPAVAADDGAKIFADACSDCHKPNKKPLDDTHMTRARWKEAVDSMIEKDKLDVPLTPEKYSILLDWLVSTHGPTDAAASTSH